MFQLFSGEPTWQLLGHPLTDVIKDDTGLVKFASVIIKSEKDSKKDLFPVTADGFLKTVGSPKQSPGGKELAKALASPVPSGGFKNETVAHLTFSRSNRFDSSNYSMSYSPWGRKERQCYAVQLGISDVDGDILRFLYNQFGEQIKLKIRFSLSSSSIASLAWTTYQKTISEWMDVLGKLPGGEIVRNRLPVLQVLMEPESTNTSASNESTDFSFETGYRTIRSLATSPSDNIALNGIHVFQDELYLPGEFFQGLISMQLVSFSIFLSLDKSRIGTVASPGCAESEDNVEDDMTIVASNGTPVRCQKKLLKLCSPVLSSSVTINSKVESILELRELNEQAVHVFVSYLQTNVLEITDLTVCFQLLKTAVTYEIPEIKRSAFEYLWDISSSNIPLNVAFDLILLGLSGTPEGSRLKEKAIESFYAKLGMLEEAKKVMVSWKCIGETETRDITTSIDTLKSCLTGFLN